MSFLVWLGELVTEKGIGNGISLIIFAGIVSSLPSIIGQGALLSDQLFQLILLVAIALLIVYLIVVFTEAQRRIPVQYGRSVFRGGRMYRQTGGSFIPLRVNSAGMIPLIFAFSLLILPASVSGYFVDPLTNSVGSQIAEFITNLLSPANVAYWILVFIMVMLFTFFYALVTFNQQNIAENLQKNGGFIPGIRPGSPTQSYLSQVMVRITWVEQFSSHGSCNAIHCWCCYKCWRCLHYYEQYKFADYGWSSSRYNASTRISITYEKL